MICIFVIIFVICGKCWDLDDYVIDQEMIDKINSDPGLPWKAGVNSIFAGKKYRDVQSMFFSTNGLNKPDFPYKEVEGRVNDLPDHFDVYEKYPQCKQPIRNQLFCGSNYAFSGAEMMTDRFCMTSKGKINEVLSPQDFVSCDKTNYGCNGGYQTNQWEYAKSVGVVSDKCFPYASGHGDVPACPYKCADESINWNNTKHKITEYYKFASVDDAMSDMLKYGSIQASFENYQDFESYKSGVYVHKFGSLGGGHCVKVQGWGIDSSSSLPYWNCAIAWGNSWGMDGYFWILRGSDECGIEDNMYGIVPDL